MGWFSSLFSANATQPIEAFGNVLDELFTSDEEELTLNNVKLRLAQKPGLAQVEINKIEATHRSPFVAGWRPFIGWVCGVGLAFYYIPQYALASFIWAKLVLETGVMQSYPVSADGLIELVLAMLGMATIRTIEKLKGVSK